jgi:hypothetical protein|tara:strand:+ start:321 stop:425 length:105 start_codon:yes stop_codon:yes gene_type:complete
VEVVSIYEASEHSREAIETKYDKNAIFIGSAVSI